MAHDPHDTTLVASGGSMFPFIPAGSLLTLDRSPIESLQRGDVIAFLDGDGRPVAHRLWHRIHDHRGRTQLLIAGDRSGRPETVPAEAYIGRAVQVRCGRLMYKTGGPTGQLMASIALRHRRCHRALERAAGVLIRLRRRIVP